MLFGATHPQPVFSQPVSFQRALLVVCGWSPRLSCALWALGAPPGKRLNKNRSGQAQKIRRQRGAAPCSIHQRVVKCRPSTIKIPRLSSKHSCYNLLIGLMISDSAHRLAGLGVFLQVHACRGTVKQIRLMHTLRGAPPNWKWIWIIMDHHPIF